jgi:hypothetical protein
MEFVDSKKIKTIVFFANIDNVNSILDSKLLNTNNEINVMLFSINENLTSFTNKRKVKHILFDEKRSIEENIDVFLKNSNIISDLSCKKNYMIDYSLEKNIKGKAALINIGTGCKAKCSFCNIADSVLKYRTLDVIMQEISSLLDLGVKYFHVMNHNFSCDRNFMTDFIEKLREMTHRYDFAWSCFVIPSFFIDNIDLLPIMVKSNLKKIEIGCESGSKALLSEMKIKHSNDDVEKIITASIDAGIPVFSAHFTMGTFQEKAKSLNDTKTFILKLLDLTNSFCDIHLHCYFPEKKHYEDISIYDKIINRKDDFVCESEDLTIENLIGYKKQLHDAIRTKRKELRNKISLQKQHQLFLLDNKYNIETQMGHDYFSKIPMYEFFSSMKERQIFFSWENPEKSFLSSPCYNSSAYIYPEKLNTDCSNLLNILSHYIRCRNYTKNEIIEMISRDSNNKITKEDICSILDQIENSGGLYYVKFLN